MSDPTFSRAVINWQRSHGRHALPWQNTRDAYRIWLSEIMLQQTQVAAVIPYYTRFLERFPDVRTLAAAPADDVMAHWAGLGYYSRARNLHKCAQQVVERYAGVFPADPLLLAELPGIGRSTAAAIAAFAYGTRAAILDGNVKRVFARVFGVDQFPGIKSVETALWQRADALLPPHGPEPGIASYTQGLMDLGATLCTRGKPACERCPLAARCVALASGRVHELPVRKPAKIAPVKHAVMLVVIDRGEILLHKRPDNGIWGGLYSLPELDGHRHAADMRDAQADQAALEAAVLPFGEFGSAQLLAPFAHTFTHFKLEVAPYLVTLARRHALAGEGTHVWCAGGALDAVALPAPVRKLLIALQSQPALPL
ncbi:MAG TPA: A/G-specific adenine glycosylase [Burkholderiaceae bacterium]